jgi:hypothetical protein
MIPKIIHQTWRSDKLPSIFEKINEKNKVLNSEFEFKMWSHSPGPPDIDEFIKKEYNDIYHIFKGVKYGVQKADIGRLAILHYYGGIYYDLDIMCIKPLQSLIDLGTDCVYMALEPAEQTKKLFNDDTILCNAFIAAPARHPLFKAAMDEIKMLFLKHGSAIYNSFNIFGSDLLAKCMHNKDIIRNVKFVNRKLVYPINDPKFTDLPSSSSDIVMLKSGDFGQAYMVHYWIHSDFESKELIEKFAYDDSKDIHQNIFKFFQQLYPGHKYLQQ